MGRDRQGAGLSPCCWPHGFGVVVGVLPLPHHVSLVPRFPFQRGGEGEDSPCNETQDVSAAVVQVSTGPSMGDAFVPSTSFIFLFPTWSSQG